MMEEKNLQNDVDVFILEKIDSVPHLEALLLVWNQRPRAWSVDDIAKALYIHADIARRILDDLALRGLIAVVQNTPSQYFYETKSREGDQLMQAVDRTYRRELVRISTMIHAKASPALRDFARAFRFTKDKEKDKQEENS